jgi:hypothetical protein
MSTKKKGIVIEIEIAKIKKSDIAYLNVSTAKGVFFINP